MAETDVSAAPPAAPFSGRTAWTRNLQTPLRSFLATESGSAAVLLAVVVAALVWANVDPASYERVWTTTLSIRVGGTGISQDLRAWIYSGSISVVPLIVAFALFGCILLVRAAGIHFGPLYFLLGTAVWISFYESGVDPVVAGLMGGVIALAYPAQRSDLERASDVFRLFREQPTGELSRTARSALRSAVSPNERLQSLWHPWTSYAIVPLFALANAGVHLSVGFLSTAYSSPVTLGIMVGYVLGKPIGIVGATWLATKLSRGRLRPPVGWASVAGAGTIAGIGFTVSILIADLAFHGTELAEAKVGVLSAAMLA